MRIVAYFLDAGWTLYQCSETFQLAVQYGVSNQSVRSHHMIDENGDVWTMMLDLYL